MDHPTATQARPQIEMVVTGSTAQLTAARDPQLPSAVRISDEIRAGLGEVASADVDVCIAPDGHVQGVKLIRGSSLAAFDDAVIHDVRDWQFASSFATRLRTCESATISFRTR